MAYGFVPQKCILATAASLLLALVCATATLADAQTIAGYEEIAVSFDVPRLMSKDIFVRYDGTTLYLPFTDVFVLLDINFERDPATKKISGFFLAKDKRYEIDPVGFRATLDGRSMELLPSDFMLEGQEIYLKIDLFQKVFGLPMQFDFSNLRVALPLNEQFPSWQKLERKAARAKLKRSAVELRNVKSLPRRHDYLSGGVADWTLSTSPIGGGGQYADITAGSMLLGGDFSLSASGNTAVGFDAKALRYRWHYTFDSLGMITQAEVGNIYTGGPLSRSLKGVAVNNAPLVQRTYYQTINLTGKLDPGWEVELYIDNRLIDYATADQTGEYNFAVAINYGSSIITLKKYGPNGEIETEEQERRVPYNLVPARTFQYSAALGTVQTTSGDKFRTNLSGYYGVVERVTAGVSADLPTAANDSDIARFSADATVQVTGDLTANAAFSPRNFVRADVSYSVPSSVVAGAAFTKYDERAQNNIAKQKHNITVSATLPFSIGSRYFGVRVHAMLDKFAASDALTVNYGFNASVSRMYVNYFGKFKRSSFPNFTAQNLSSQALISAEFVQWFRPQIRLDYDHTVNTFTRIGTYITKRFLRTGQVTMSYEYNPQAKSNSIMLSLSFFSSFANFATRGLWTDGQMSMSQIQRGSIRYDRTDGAVRFDRRNGVGLGSAVVRPFLDKNNDGSVDEGEEFLPGLRARMTGVGGRPIGKDRIFLYDGLRPYDPYLVQIDDASLDNPLLRPAYENFKVAVAPNVVTAIDVPVVMAADITGTVVRQTVAGAVGLGGIRIKAFNMTQDVITEIITFNSGEFYYLGLLPGKYRAYLDPAQLAQYGYVAAPESIEFEVKATENGDSVKDVNFVLTPKP